MRPRVPLNATWSGTADKRIAADGAIDIAWWHAFEDPALDHLIELAHHQNLTIQLAGVRILEARAQLGFAVADQYPTNPGPIATAEAVGISQHSANSSFIDRHFGNYEVGFDALWEADIWGKQRRGVRAARAAYYATVADYDDALVSISAEIARTYVLIRTVEVNIEQARQNAAIQQEGLDIAQARFQHGATSELDVAQATNLLETTRATIPELEARLQKARNALSTLLARPTGTVEALLADQRGIPSPPARVAVGVPADLLRRRPDIRAAELRAIAQCNRIGMAKADLYPKLMLFGSVGTQTSTNAGREGDNSTLANLFGPGSLVYNAGGSLFWPILSYPRILNNVRVEDARFQEALISYVNTVLAAAQEVEDGLSGYLHQQDSAVFGQNAVTAAENGVKLALVQYREGAVDYQRVLETQRALLDSQNRLADTHSAVATELIALYKALGGGWELRDGQPVVTDATRREMQQRTNWGKYFSKPPGRQAR